MKRNPASWWTGLAFALVVLLVVDLPGYAADVPVVQVDLGAEGRQPLTPPADGFEPVAATSSASVSVTGEQPNSALGGWRVNFKYTNNRGSTPATITVTWKSKQTNEERHTFFVVSPDPVSQATSVQIPQGSTATVGVPADARAALFQGVLYDSAHAGPSIKDGKVSITPTRSGIGEVVLFSKDDDYVLIIIVDVTSKATTASTPSNTTPRGSGATATGGAPSVIVTTPLITGPTDFGIGVKTLPVYKDPKTGNTTTGTTKR